MRLYELFGIEPQHTDLLDGLLMIVEADGQRVGLFVDELMSQQQVVIKSLETNFRPVLGLAGATMLGDGRVALILDIPGVITRFQAREGRRDPAQRGGMSAVSYVKEYAANDTRQFLTFKLAGEEYGVGILAVKEIRGWSAVTAMPHAPPWMLGVINLRGVVVPVIDLRLKLNFERAEYNDHTVVIVVSVGDLLAGIVVDAVSDVIMLSAADIKPPPSLGNQADTSHIIGFGTADGRMRILLDIERLLAGTELSTANALQ